MSVATFDCHERVAAQNESSAFLAGHAPVPRLSQPAQQQPEAAQHSQPSALRVGWQRAIPPTEQ
jgi:hypothetical protein